MFKIRLKLSIYVRKWHFCCEKKYCKHFFISLRSLDSIIRNFKICYLVQSILLQKFYIEEFQPQEFFYATSRKFFLDRIFLEDKRTFFLHAFCE